MLWNGKLGSAMTEMDDDASAPLSQRKLPMHHNFDHTITIITITITIISHYNHHHHHQLTLVTLVPSNLKANETLTSKGSMITNGVFLTCPP